MRVLFALAFLLGCTPTVEPPMSPPTHSLEIGNGTTIDVTLVVNGKVLGVFPPGAAGVIPVDQLPPSGGRAYQSAGARADLSCGRLDVWSGMLMLGLLPGPGRPGDCDP